MISDKTLKLKFLSFFCVLIEIEKLLNDDQHEVLALEADMPGFFTPPPPLSNFKENVQLT